MMAEALTDEKTFDAKSAAWLKRFNRWQATEYNTAVARCRTAKQFKQFEERHEVFPNIEWLPSRSVQLREEHVKLYHVVRPINDPLWQENQPGNLYNCKCDWQQTDKEPTGGTVKNAIHNPGLDGNPAKTYSVFTEKHPYYNKVKDAASVESFVKDYVWNQFIEIEKHSNGGAFYLHPFKLKSESDFADLNVIAKKWAKNADVVYVMPDVHKDGLYYKYLFDGAYERKCPDILKNKKFYEYKSYDGQFDTDKVSNMFKGVRQSQYIIIDNTNGATDRWLLRNIRDRIDNGQKIEEVWLFENNKIRLLFKNTIAP